MVKSVLNLLSLKYICANQVAVQLIDMRLWSSEYISKPKIQILEKAQGVKKSNEHTSIRIPDCSRTCLSNQRGNQESVTNTLPREQELCGKLLFFFPGPLFLRNLQKRPMIPSFSKRPLRERCRERGGARQSKVVRGWLPSGPTGRGHAEDEKAQTKARTTGPRQAQFFQGPQSPTRRQLVRSEVTTQESVGSWPGVGGYAPHQLRGADSNTKARPPRRRLARKWFRRKAGFGKADYLSQHALRGASRGVPPRQISRGDNGAESGSPNERWMQVLRTLLTSFCLCLPRSRCEPSPSLPQRSYSEWLLP